MPDVLAMHIPDGFLASEVAAAAAVLALVAVGYALRRRGPRARRATACRCWACSPRSSSPSQMLNFPVAGGTSGHLLGATLAAVLLGPWLACLVMAVVLDRQAFVFADGGITALGANVLNMGVLGALLAGVLRRHPAPAAADARRLPRPSSAIVRVARGDGSAPRPRASSSRSRARSRSARCCRRCSACTR